MFSIARTIAGQTSTKTIYQASCALLSSSVPKEFQFGTKTDLIHSTPSHTVYWYKNDGCVIKDLDGKFQYGMRFMPNGKTTCYHANGATYHIDGIQDIVQKHFANTPYVDEQTNAYTGSI